VVVFPVQPALLAKYRNALVPSRAKDDPTDAEFALELLLRYPDKVPRLKPESRAMRMLRQLLETLRTLVDDRVRALNRITASLKAYFPQVLDLFREKETAVNECVASEVSATVSAMSIVTVRGTEEHCY